MTVAVLGIVSDTDTKIAAIEGRRKMVEEVQTRANAITNLLDDVNVNLEMLGEQRAVIDHVGEKIARLDYTVQEAQNTLRALQRCALRRCPARLRLLSCLVKVTE